VQATCPHDSMPWLLCGAAGVSDRLARYTVSLTRSCALHVCRETWIVMDLMDRGTLASAVRRGVFVADSKLRAVSANGS
jgi:hypothetical protein